MFFKDIEEMTEKVTSVLKSELEISDNIFDVYDAQMKATHDINEFSKKTIPDADGTEGPDMAMDILFALAKVTRTMMTQAVMSSDRIRELGGENAKSYNMEISTSKEGIMFPLSTTTVRVYDKRGTLREIKRYGEEAERLYKYAQETAQETGNTLETYIRIACEFYED